jgi:hypothetical protein
MLMTPGQGRGLQPDALFRTNTGAQGATAFARGRPKSEASIPTVVLPELIALKVLAGRSQDLTDLGYLIPAASPADLDAAREAVKLIQERGFNRGQDVVVDLETLIADAKP